MSEIIRFLSKLKPAVNKKWLVLISGLMWSGVGIMLWGLAVGWLLPVSPMRAVFLGAAGLVVSLLIYRFGFLRIARRNISRVWGYEDKVCLFAFQQWHSYLLVAVMITLGISLRHSGFPKPYLAVLYTAIAGGLFFSSLHYYRHLWINR